MNGLETFYTEQWTKASPLSHHVFQKSIHTLVSIINLLFNIENFKAKVHD